jgi:Spo0E like sporulation regulatory protein.
MSGCACRTQIEKLRQIMQLTYDEYQSFTDPTVLLASQALDNALVNYRSCPCFDICNSWGNEDEEIKCMRMVG